MLLFFRAFTGLVALGCATLARAHDPGLSTALFALRPDGITLTVAFAPSDVHALLGPAAPASRHWTPADFADAQPALLALAPQLGELRAAGVVLAPQSVRAELAAGDSVNFLFAYARPTAGPLAFRSLKFSALPPGHRQFLEATDEHHVSLAQKLLFAAAPAVEFPLTPAPAADAPPSSPSAVTPPAEPAAPPSFWGFMKLGVEHIWTGYDHLLFLFALLVVCRSFRSIVTIISCFTLAHSLTLALATLNLVNLPSRFVEPAIAASIIFVGAENLLRRGAEPRGRWALTFFFGLIHGFGFASVLRELGVGEGGRGLAMPLFTFNLGVEAGQVAIAALVLPIVWQLRKNEAFVRRGVPALSAIVVAAGLYWFLERTVFA